MGKTYRNVYSGSNSVSYKTPHSRKFARLKKEHSHRKIRTHNKTCDEDNMINLKDLNGRQTMNNHFASGYWGESGNIPNKEWFRFTDENMRKYFSFEWNKEDENILGTIDRAIKTSESQSTIPELIATKKQIERRGELGPFYGHRI